MGEQFFASERERFVNIIWHGKAGLVLVLVRLCEEELLQHFGADIKRVGRPASGVDTVFKEKLK